MKRKKLIRCTKCEKLLEDRYDYVIVKKKRVCVCCEKYGKNNLFRSFKKIKNS